LLKRPDWVIHTRKAEKRCAPDDKVTTMTNKGKYPSFYCTEKLLPYINIKYYMAKYLKSCMLHDVQSFTISRVGAVSLVKQTVCATGV
jgi:hypothetical protein